MSDLVAFLNARLGEDEEAAKAAFRQPDWLVGDDGGFTPPRPESRCFTVYAEAQITLQLPIADMWTQESADHVARHDPARVLREVEAKHRIVEDYRISRNACRNMTGSELDSIGYKMLVAGRDAFRSACVSLAAVYSDHADYDPAWP